MIQRSELLELLQAREDHFLYESGHHGSLWLELERLCLRPASLRPFIEELVDQLEEVEYDLICGPLNEGGFLGLLIADRLNSEFVYTEPQPKLTTNGQHGSSNDRLFPFCYRLPDGLRDRVDGKRIAIVNDVFNAGSAVKGTVTELERCGAEVSVLATLIVLGEEAQRYATRHEFELITLAQIENELWTPDECPLCAQGRPLIDIAGFGERLTASHVAK